MTPTPFSIDIQQRDVDRLRQRLLETRFPGVPDNSDWSRGTSGEYLRELVAAWAEDFDWSAAQARLNEIPQFVTTVTAGPDEVDLHFLHARCDAPGAVALLMVHGWPDSPFRFRTAIPELVSAGAQGVQTFDVVAPSLPGFHFSGHRALHSDRVADLLADLMTQLGYERFVLAGGDLGTPVGLSMGRRHPDRLIGLHLTNAEYPTGQEQDLTEDEQRYADFIQQWWFTQGAYAAVQSTKPQIVGPALADSPAGLAAFMLGLVETGADGHDVEAAFGGRDELLTNFSLYHFTNTAASGADAYRAQATGSTWGTTPDRVEVPTGFAIFPREAQSPREWCERQATVVRYTKMARGGHFAALEVTQDYVDELRSFVGDLHDD